MTQDKNHVDPQSGKPSWFQLVDSEAPSAQVVKVNKKLPLIALFVTGAIVASGTFFAHASNGNSKTTQPITTTNSSATATPATSASPDASNLSTASTSAPTAPAVQNPSQGGVQEPGMGGDEDDHDGREGHEREGHEREGHEREGHERGERDHEDRD